MVGILSGHPTASRRRSAGDDPGKDGRRVCRFSGVAVVGLIPANIAAFLVEDADSSTLHKVSSRQDEDSAKLRKVSQQLDRLERHLSATADVDTLVAPRTIE